MNRSTPAMAVVAPSQGPAWLVVTSAEVEGSSFQDHDGEFAPPRVLVGVGRRQVGLYATGARDDPTAAGQAGSGPRTVPDLRVPEFER